MGDETQRPIRSDLDERICFQRSFLAGGVLQRYGDNARAVPPNWLHERFLEEGAIYRSENFLLYCLGQFVVCLMVAQLYLQTRSLPAPILLLDTLLFSLLFWLMPRETVRTRHLYFVVQGALVCAGYTQSYHFVYLFFILAGQAMYLFKPRTGLLWTGAFVVITLSGNFYLYSDALGILFPATRAVLTMFGFCTFAIMAQQIRVARWESGRADSLLKEMAEANERLQQYATQAQSLAVAEERNRLASELHDALGHRLTVSIVQLEGAARLMDREPGRVAGMIETTRAQLAEGLDELRHTLDALHTPLLAGDNLLSSLRQVADAFATATGVALHIQLPDRLPPLSDAQGMTIYRTVQEALTNTQKHARARNVWLTLDIASDRLILTARNDGRDFIPSNSRGYGLRGIEERAVQLRGSLQVNRPESGGTLLTLSLPIEKEEASFYV